MSLTAAVTGPTGEIGISTVDALERSPEFERVIGMARRPFDPAAHGWGKTEYRQGDILDPAAVARLVAEADVVIHLAYLIMGSREDSRRINLAGTRNVVEATVAAARPARLVYTSSVAAYGYHPDNPLPLTEDVPVRGSSEHYYSAQKAECEAVLRDITEGSGLEVYVLRPCIVAGPAATALADSMPWRRVARMVPTPLRWPVAAAQRILPLMPDPGVWLQLVHHDDVAAAITLAALGAGEPGAYNLAGDGEISLSDVARATGAGAFRVPSAAATVTSTLLARMPLVPAAAEWVHAGRRSVVMDSTRAKKVLGWQPRYTSEQTLAQLAAVL